MEYSSSLSEEELMEMANLDYESSGIDGVIIWVGPNPHFHGRRVKISNIPNRFDGKDCFTLTIPDFKIIGNINKSLITNKKFEQIKEFINNNLHLINDYSDYKISTKNLIDNLKRINGV